MIQSRWPDALSVVEPLRVQDLLATFWRTLSLLPDLLGRQEYLLAADTTSRLRAIVTEMMLALNGIQKPPNTRHLNTYLSDTQRKALQKTLIMPNVDSEAWIGHAVALVVIYRWYAPQLVEKLEIHYPHELEKVAWKELVAQLPSWPKVITSG